jgi:diacylglycerol kinase family enzyme
MLGSMSAVLQSSQPEASDTGAWSEAELFIVLNLASGKHDKDGVRRAIEGELMHACRQYRFVPVEPGQVVQACQHAAQLAKEHGGVLVAVGGDGTINCAAQAAWTHDVPLALIAQGTFNLFSRQLGLPLDPDAAARCILQAQPEPVQVGSVNQRLFLVNASVGLYPKLLADRENVKQKLGRRRWIAFLAGIVSLFEWRLQLALDVDLDGDVKRLRTPSLFVCNNRLQLERLGVDEEVVRQVGEGWLAGLMARPMNAFAKLRLIARAIAGKLGDADDVESFTLRSMTVSTRNARRLKVATDGEVQWMELPLRFAVTPRPLRVMLPPVHMRVPAE